MTDFAYENGPRVGYQGGAQFVAVCETCGRFVKADATIKVSEGNGLSSGPNATCSKCGRTRMLFEGFIAEEDS